MQLNVVLVECSFGQPYSSVFHITINDWINPRISFEIRCFFSSSSFLYLARLHALRKVVLQIMVHTIICWYNITQFLWFKWPYYRTKPNKSEINIWQNEQANMIQQAVTKRDSGIQIAGRLKRESCKCCIRVSLLCIYGAIEYQDAYRCTKVVVSLNIIFIVKWPRI